MSAQPQMSFVMRRWIVGFALNDGMLQDWGELECGIERMTTAHRTLPFSRWYFRVAKSEDETVQAK